MTRLPAVPSTNDLALESMRAGRAAPGELIVAEEQTAGRGRPGRTWVSQRGALLCTAILPFYPERAGWTALAAGVAVARAVRELGAPAGVKWPNDVVLSGRKLAGILVETCVPGLAAVGIGLNVRNPAPPALPIAVLADFLPAVDLESVLQALLPQLVLAWEQLAGPDLLNLRDAWLELDTTRGRRVRWVEERVTGEAEGIDASGALLIRAEDGRLLTAQVGEVGFLDP